MNAQDLKSVQAPLKDRYREEPAAAFITLRAQGRLGEGVSCTIETGKAQKTYADDGGAHVGFQSVRLRFTLDTDATAEQVATLIRLTERYCVVYQTLANPLPLAVETHIAPAGWG